MIFIFKSVFSKRQNILWVLVLSLTIFLTLRILPVFSILKSSFTLPHISLGRKLEIFFDYTIASFIQAGGTEQWLVLALTLATAMNIILFVAYAKRQRQLLSGKSFFASISGMTLGLFGVGCLSCGALLMAPLMSLVGLGAFVSGARHYAVLLSLGGLVLVIFSILFLLKKLSEPLVCKV